MTALGQSETTTGVEQAEKELLAVLALKEPTHGEINTLISNYRTAAEAFLFKDFTAAAAKHTEHHLWAAHGKVNNKYRSHLAKFRNAQGKKRPVERRKVENHYLDFVKSSMRFYRGYIQRLASHFRSPQEVLDVAHKFHSDTLSADPLIEPSQQEKQLILESCHATLVRLGDLSRYRETELQTKQRNWAPAIGYYDLARTIIPSSGASHNQFAVMALADGNHMKALYYLYRALSVENPYPKALENLEAEFKKILDQKRKNQLFPQPLDRGPGAVLQAWVLYLHARLNAGANFRDYEELENEVLTNLSVELKERPLGGFLNRFALTNIAAQHLASIQAAELSANGSQYQAFTFYLRLNIKSFFTLLQILLSDLEQFVAEDASPSDFPSQTDISSRFSATTRRIVPTLRQYSSWLVSNASYLVGHEDHDLMAVQIEEFWRTYAHVLTLLGSIFEESSFPNLAYLLEEDEDTIAFTPFKTSSTSRRYLQADGVTLRPRRPNEAVQRHGYTSEMLFRVKGLIEDGLSLVVREGDRSQTPVPLAVEDSCFQFRQKGNPAASSCSKSHAHSHTASSIQHDNAKRDNHNGRPRSRSDDNADDSVSVAASVSASIAMHRMVDSLVTSEASESLEPSPHFPQNFQGSSRYAPATVDSENGPYRSSSSGLKATISPAENPASIPAALPSIWNSPFAPRPGSPRTLSSTMHNFPITTTTHTPFAQSSNTTFREALLRQQQELEMQQPSSYDLPTSLSRHPSSVPNARFLARESSPTPSPFSDAASIPSATFPAYEVQRNVPEQARFGAVGQTPPSAQGG